MRVLVFDNQVQVFGERGKPLKPRTSPDGYQQVKVKRNGKWQWANVHRLVAETFIPNPENLSDVDHINGNKLDNRVENLQWMSREGNVKKALSQPCQGENSEGFGYYFPSQADAVQFGFYQPLISKCISGERKTHKKMRWLSL